MKRYGSVIRLTEGKYQEYKTLHKQVWPEIQELIRDCNITNYSIYYKDGYLFSYYEYTGNDYEVDMKKMSDHPRNKEWWSFCSPCQQPLETRKKGEWWAEMEELFHMD